MYLCNLCNKEFEFQSTLERHTNKKIPCNYIKEVYNCKICNKIFNHKSRLNTHNKSKKHIINNITYNQTAETINNAETININNIINLTLNVKPFKDTDINIIKQNVIERIGVAYLETIFNDDLHINEKILELFDKSIYLLEFLHFNLGLDDNHNCKILLMFPNLNKTVFEYLILEMNSDTKLVQWIRLDYIDFIKEILNVLKKINSNFNIENFNKYIEFLEKNLITDTERSAIIKPKIETLLNNLYLKFNNKQNKTTRCVSDNTDILDRIKEYRDYRKNECRLANGFDPEIVNSRI